MENADKQFHSMLKQYNKDKCPECGKVIERGDVMWNSGSTEYGTPFTFIEIMCSRCDTEIVYGSSWYPSCDDFEDMVKNALEDVFE